jgi:hypothetical protein
MTVSKQSIPNDRRTRQLFIDAAIKRAQARARDVRRQEDEAGDAELALLDPTSISHAPVGAVPSPRASDDRTD